MGASDLQRSKTGRPWKASLERKGTRPPQVFLRPGTEHVPPSGKGTRSHPWSLFYIHSLYVVYTPSLSHLLFRLLLSVSSHTLLSEP